RTDSYECYLNQANLEIIFDKHYLSAKIDSEVINIWFQKLLNENNM
ncbi:17215_t:CDS:1, partial [Racocetra persica]